MDSHIAHVGLPSSAQPTALDEAELFQKMLAHGGKPEQECSERIEGGKHLDCWKIALGWGSKNVVEILRNRDNTA